jgi:hypothetical protein
MTFDPMMPDDRDLRSYRGGFVDMGWVMAVAMGQSGLAGNLVIGSMRSLRSQTHWDESRSVLEISIHVFQIDKVLTCVDAEAALPAQGDEEEDDAGESPGLYRVARYLVPAAMIEAVVREPHLTRLT